MVNQTDGKVVNEPSRNDKTAILRFTFKNESELVLFEKKKWKGAPAVLTEFLAEIKEEKNKITNLLHVHYFFTKHWYLPLCYWSRQLFDLRAPSSTDVPVLLLHQPNDARYTNVNDARFELATIWLVVIESTCVQPSVRGRCAGYFPEQRLVIEPM